MITNTAPNSLTLAAEAVKAAEAAAEQAEKAVDRAVSDE